MAIYKGMESRFGLRLLRVLTIGATIGYSAPNFSQVEESVNAQESSRAGGIEEVIVTAQKREQSLEDVPISITALTTEALQDRGISDFATYLRSIPSATFADQGNQGSEIKIRGVGNGTARLSPTVAVYLGDVPVIHNGRSINSSYDFFITDMQRIEVLRGPQGQLYGSNSLGGAIKNIPNKPGFTETTINANASWAAMNEGSDSYSGSMTLNFPLSDTVGMRLTAYGEHQGGWIDNVFRGGTRIGGDPNPLPGGKFGDALAAGDPGVMAKNIYQVPLPPNIFLNLEPPASWFSPLRLDGMKNYYFGLDPNDDSVYQQVINYVTPSNAKKDVNESDRWGGRAMFTWEATDTFTADLMVAYEDKENTGTSWVTHIPEVPGPWGAATGNVGPQTYALPKPLRSGQTLPPGTFRNPEAVQPSLYPTSVKSYEQANPIDAGNSDEMSLFNLVLTWQLGFAELTSSSSYWNRTTVLETPLPLAMVETGVDGVWPVKNKRNDNPDALIQELRLTSSDEGPLTWLVGLFYNDTHQDFTIDIIDPTGFMMVNLWPPNPAAAGTPGAAPWPAGTPSVNIGQTKGTFDDTQRAVFGQIAYDVLPTVNVALSGRQFHVEQSADITYSGLFNTPIQGFPTHRDNSDNQFVPAATVTWTPVEDKLYYVTASKGYRSGVVNENIPSVNPGDSCYTVMQNLKNSGKVAISDDNQLPDTDPDTAWNYEVGAKMTFADRKYMLNGAVYRIDWSDLQSQVFLQGFEPSGVCTYDRLFNVGGATIKGGELEGVMQATDQIQLTAAFSYTDGTYDDGFNELGIQAGDTIEGTAKTTYYFGAQYNFDVYSRTGFVRADYNYTGSIAARPADFYVVPVQYKPGEFQIVNMRGALNLTENLTTEIFINNMFNEFGVSRAIDNTGTAPQTYFTIPPRTVGAAMRIKF